MKNLVLWPLESSARDRNSVDGSLQASCPVYVHNSFGQRYARLAGSRGLRAPAHFC